MEHKPYRTFGDPTSDHIRVRGESVTLVWGGGDEWKELGLSAIRVEGDGTFEKVVWEDSIEDEDCWYLDFLPGEKETLEALIEEASDE